MEILHVNEDTFQKEVLQASQPVLLDFYAQWCGPCKMLGEVLEELAAEQQDFKIVKVDIDQNRNLTKQWEIGTVPTVFMVKNGQVKDSAKGFVPKQVLLEKMRML